MIPVQYYKARSSLLFTLREVVRRCACHSTTTSTSLRLSRRGTKSTGGAGALEKKKGKKKEKKGKRKGRKKGKRKEEREKTTVNLVLYINA